MIPHLSERALVLAPQGRDSAVAGAILAEAGLRFEVANSVPELVAHVREGAGFGLVTEEALDGADLRELSGWIEGQPEWSDFPFILLTQRAWGLERNPAAARYLEVLGNVTFLERPFHPTTLVSLAQSALRGRRRQYEARAGSRISTSLPRTSSGASRSGPQSTKWHSHSSMRRRSSRRLAS